MTQTEHFSDIYDDIYGDAEIIPPLPLPPGHEAILFPDILKIVIDWLNFTISAGIAVAHSRVPDERPLAFIKVELTGGVRQTLVTDGPQVTVDAWAEREEDALAIGQLARARLGQMAGTVQQGVTIYGVHEFSGPQLLPDPLSSQPRSTFTTQVVCRGIALA